jgi:Flp pilus assembly protein CpaB
MPTSTPELTSKKKRPPAVGSKKLVLATRRGTFALAGVAALAALAVLLVFMSNYRDSVRSGADELTVLVANRAIDKGTSGDVIAEAGLFSSTKVSEVDASEGAFADPSALRGQVANEAIYKGEQLTAGSFGSGADPIAGRLEGIQRALAIPVAEAEGNVGQLDAGSRIDVLGGFNAEQSGGRTRPVMDVLARDVLVLKAPDAPSSSTSSANNDEHQVVVRVTDVEASRIAFAADTGQIWLTIRPPTMAKNSNINPVQLENLLGLDTIQLGG